MPPAKLADDTADLVFEPVKFTRLDLGCRDQGFNDLRRVFWCIRDDINNPVRKSGLDQ